MKTRSVGTFVQIGGMLINMAQVVEGYISADEVVLHFSPRVDDLEEEYPIILRDEKREAFLEWWERQADLTLLSLYRFSSSSPVSV